MSETVRESESSGGALPAAGQDASGEAQIPLPRFLVRQSDGLHVSLAALESPALLRAFVDRVFTSGLLFTDLNYPALHKLLYECEQADIERMIQDLRKAGRVATLKLARDIAVFPPDRRRFYRDPKLAEDGQEAEYLFEPVTDDVVVDEPVYGDPDADGKRPIVDHLRKTVPTRVTLSLDEFVAAMWTKDVRFGIDAAAVQQAIAGSRVERVVVARMKPPASGQDASVQELTRSLHRDDSPKMLADGRIDLHQFQNHFPQVEKNTRLLRKIPLVTGKSGWDIAGHELAPDVSRDLDIAQVSGIGTRVERLADGEFVVADVGGFLQIDAASGSISILDKIVNREGVGLRSTGNLRLDGDEYEEHGEVLEKSKVEGKNMTFLADVFGNITSHGGRVVLKRNLNGGSIRDLEGSIEIEGNASRATLEAIGGEITLGHAEGCLIIGKKVTIGRAVQCDVLAEELTVDVSEGSALAARRMQVGTAKARRDAETTISMLIPDLSAFARELDELRRKQAEYEETVTFLSQNIETLKSQQEVRSYLLINARIQAKEIQMTPEQSANWKKLVAKVAPILRHLKTMSDGVQSGRAAISDIAGKIAQLTQDCQAMSTGISCNAPNIAGETVIRGLMVRLDATPLHQLQPRELRARLHGSGADCRVLFSGNSGEFHWEFEEKIPVQPAPSSPPATAP